MKRGGGVLMHITSLFGDYSSGSFGSAAKYFIDFLADCGFTYWQVLPFCMVDECNSPYKSYSSFGGNPYFVDLENLYKRGLITESELSSCRQQAPYSCEYVKLYHTRNNILMAASKRAENRTEIESFIEANPYIEEFCCFMSLKRANNEKKWTEWETDIIDQDVLFMWKFIQFEFFHQWREIKAYANSKNIQIIGDIPIYVSFDSCDVWSNKELFLLDEKNCPTCVAGVPPDFFSADGQLWGNPIYDWGKMKEDNYKWWKDRISHMFSMFDCIRIDHFRALDSFWCIPADAATAREGKWVKGPGEAFIDAIKNAADGKMIIAEDLGMITEDVVKLVRYSEFPSMRVFQFGFFGGESTHMPHNYPNNCIAYTGTHDNNTLLGYVWELDSGIRREMLEYCGYTDSDWSGGYDSIIRTMFQSHAGIIILPIQDLLGFGSDTRLNIPGKADGNWQFRITKEQLDSIDRTKYRRLNYLYKR